MYFDTFPREAVDQLSETGPFYVRHRDGTMRSRGRPAHGMGPPGKRPRLESPGAELDQRSSNASGVNGAPRKLFSLCLDFVAENIHLVDSLVDFPEMVGHQLFKAVQDAGRFQVPDDAARTLGLFCEAYGSLVLSSLTARGQVLPLNDYLQPGIQYMTALQQLDLSNCGLGDEHGILGEISQMSSLIQLSLQGNFLSQRGVQRVTLPYKMFGRGPAGMEVFNLADNAELSDKVVGCLVPFKRLRAVNLSNTSLTKSGIKKLCDQGWAEWTDTLPEFSEDNAISNIGWAQKVVEDWFQPAKTQNSCVPTTADDESQSDRRSLSLRKFYRKTLPPKQKHLKNQNRRLQGHLHLYRKVTNNSQEKYTSVPATQGKLSCNIAQTTKRYDSSDHVIFEKTTTKQKCTQSRQLSKQDGNKSLKENNNMTVVVREKDEDKFNSWSDEEGDLLKSYLQPESKPSTKLSLMSAMESW
ncbi:leucine-rich repeat-containing protein 42-like [Branchiostoma floridae x Branchiostoma belcheri]